MHLFLGCFRNKQALPCAHLCNASQAAGILQSMTWWQAMQKSRYYLPLGPATGDQLQLGHTQPARTKLVVSALQDLQQLPRSCVTGKVQLRLSSTSFLWIIYFNPVRVPTEQQGLWCFCAFSVPNDPHDAELQPLSETCWMMWRDQIRATSTTLPCGGPQPSTSEESPKRLYNISQVPFISILFTGSRKLWCLLMTQNHKTCRLVEVAVVHWLEVGRLVGFNHPLLSRSSCWPSPSGQWGGALAHKQPAPTICQAENAHVASQLTCLYLCTSWGASSQPNGCQQRWLLDPNSLGLSLSALGRHNNLRIPWDPPQWAATQRPFPIELRRVLPQSKTHNVSGASQPRRCRLDLVGPWNGIKWWI